MASTGFSCVSLLLLSLISICLFHLTCSCCVLFHNVSLKPNLLYKEVLKYKINDCCFVWSDSVTTVTIHKNICYKETTVCMFFCMNYILAEKCTFSFMDMSNTVFLCQIIHVLWCEMQKIIDSSKLCSFEKTDMVTLVKINLQNNPAIIIIIIAKTYLVLKYYLCS